MRSPEPPQHGLSAHGALVDPDCLCGALNPARHGQGTRAVGQRLPWSDVAALLAVCLCDILLVSPQWLR